MIKKTLIIVSAGFCLSVFSSSRYKNSLSPKQSVLKTIVIDAGHGIRPNGSYDGARGSFSWEDQICLAISKILVNDIKREFPEIRIVETRPTEKIVSLYRRAEIANENKGDLFISIHANAAPPIRKSEIIGYKKVSYYVGKGKNKKKITKQVPQYRYWTEPSKAKGTETYIWGAHKNSDKELAIRENAPMLEEENYQEKYGTVDVNSPEFIAMALLKTKQYFKRSATFAAMVQDEFLKVGRVDRDVRQRAIGIWVLQATAMPSVLIETGFITNPEEEIYLNSKEGQQEISRCITLALKNYIKWLEKKRQDNGEDKEDTKFSHKHYDPAATRKFLEYIETYEHNCNQGKLVR